MRRIRLITAGAAVAAVSLTAAAGAAGAPQGAAAAREFEGRVVSVDRGARTFRLRDSERGTVRIRVNGRTRYERISGFGGLRVGMRNVEAVVRRSNGAWLALSVERSGGGGEHGGHDGRGGDDRRGGDDDRGRGRGGDD